MNQSIELLTGASNNALEEFNALTYDFIMEHLTKHLSSLDECRQCLQSIMIEVRDANPKDQSQKIKKISNDFPPFSPEEINDFEHLVHGFLRKHHRTFATNNESSDANQKLSDIAVLIRSNSNQEAAYESSINEEEIVIELLVNKEQYQMNNADLATSEELGKFPHIPDEALKQFAEITHNFLARYLKEDQIKHVEIDVKWKPKAEDGKVMFAEAMWVTGCVADSGHIFCSPKYWGTIRR